MQEDDFIYKSSNVLFIYMDYVASSIELKSEMENIKFTNLFIILSCKNSGFNLASSTYKRIKNVTYLYSDELIVLFKQKILNEFKVIFSNKMKKRITEKLTFKNSSLCDALTKQEYVFIKYFKQGFSGRDIAKILNKSEKTVSSQKRSAMKKIGARTDSELLRNI